MSGAARPALVTALLSAAALAGYLTYRLLAGSEPEPPAAAVLNTGETEEVEQTAAAALPDQLPHFELNDLTGTPTSIHSWPGQPLVINFWATWCAPCLREIPMLKALQAEHPWLTVVGIAVDRDEPVAQFAAEMDFNYPILVGQAEGWEAAAEFGQFYALPFTIFTAGDGSVLGAHLGELHAEDLENLVGVLEDLRAGRADVAAARARLDRRM